MAGYRINRMYVVLSVLFYKRCFRCLIAQVELVELPFDKTKNQRRAFGFVTFESEEIVDNICSNSKVPFGDKMASQLVFESKIMYIPQFKM